MRLDVGCGAIRDGDVGMDRFPSPAASVVHDLLDVPWPFPDATFDSVVSHQVFEHLPAGGDEAGKDHLFRICDEAWRVLKPGGTLEFDVPHARGRSAFGDITHRRYFVPFAFSHLWDGSRDAWYPRKIWALEYCRVYRWMPYAWHVRTHYPRVAAVVGRLPFTHPHVIFVKLRKVATDRPSPGRDLGAGA